LTIVWIQMIKFPSLSFISFSIWYWNVFRNKIDTPLLLLDWELNVISLPLLFLFFCFFWQVIFFGGGGGAYLFWVFFGDVGSLFFFSPHSGVFKYLMKKGNNSKMGNQILLQNCRVGRSWHVEHVCSLNLASISRLLGNNSKTVNNIRHLTG
jgi:hypothetical protein